MYDDRSDYKPIRGKTLPITVSRDIGYEDLKKMAHEKHALWHEIHGSPEQYDLLYPHGLKATHIPGTGDPFTLRAFQASISKLYSRITLYLRKAVSSPPASVTVASATSETSDVLDISSDDDFEVVIPHARNACARRATATAVVDVNADTVMILSFEIILHFIFLAHQ